jgi:hypothetical protein
MATGPNEGLDPYVDTGPSNEPSTLDEFVNEKK